jgi:hypothetical protein
MRLKSLLIATIALPFIAMAATGQDRPEPVSGSPQQLAYVKLKVWLAGPYSGGSMTTFLISPIIYAPLSQPYADAAFNGTPMDYDGTESVAGWGGALSTAVDWVLVEIRTTTAAASKVATRAAILLSDGSIKDTDGTSDVVFSGVASGDYYVVVRHRNHVPIMSNAVVTLTGTPPATLYDMTVEANIYSGIGAGGAKDLGSGAFGLYAGDANGGGGTGAEDQAIWLGNPSAAGYLPADYNLGGGTGAEDQAIWLGNPSVGTLVPEI